MRIKAPSSRVSLRIRLSLFDVALATLSPWLALYVRDAYILSYDGLTLAALYCLVSLIFSLIGLAVFGVHDGIPRYFSAHDAINLAKAVVIGELMTCVVLFTVTRLEGIPRSTPVIHALLFGAGLVTIRALAHVTGRERRAAGRPWPTETEHVVLVGLNDLSSLYMKLLEACAPEQQVIVAVLDEEPKSIGRSINGVRVFGPPSHLPSLIEEFAVHGIRVDRVVVGGEADILTEEGLEEIERVCRQRNLRLQFVPRLFGLDRPEPLVTEPAHAEAALAPSQEPDFALPRYFRFKRLVDFTIAFLLVVSLLPLWVAVACLAYLDVGPPILFWQRRAGLNGRYFLVHKIRTLRPPLDWRGEHVPEAQRVSWFGRLLRTIRLDELPQLLNVLVGDMSLVGPRPLLPQDQPATPSVRLKVRPGITGWAQVNGGTLLSPTEKEELDEWYMRHASPWLDIRILGLTLLSLIRGDRRSEPALAQARQRPVAIEIETARTAPRHAAPSPVRSVAVPPLLGENRPPQRLAR